MICKKVTTRLREGKKEKERAVPGATLNFHLFPVLTYTGNKLL